MCNIRTRTYRAISAVTKLTVRGGSRDYPFARSTIPMQYLAALLRSFTGIIILPGMYIDRRIRDRVPADWTGTRDVI